MNTGTETSRDRSTADLVIFILGMIALVVVALVLVVGVNLLQMSYAGCFSPDVASGCNLDLATTGRIAFYILSAVAVIGAGLWGMWRRSAGETTWWVPLVGVATLIAGFAANVVLAYQAMP